MRATATRATPGRRHVRASLRAGRDGWYRIRNNATTGHADVWLFDEIGYWGVTAADFANELKTVTAQQITLHINSPGGEVFDGLAIYNCIKAHPANVHVRVEGLAASAASFIAMAGDKITCARNATMMIHDAAGLCVGNAADMRELADLLDKMSDNIADIYARRCGGTVDWWRELMRAETWYTGAEAVAAGLADEQTDPDEMEPDEDRPAEMDNRWDLSFYDHAGREAAPPPPARPPVDAVAVETVEAEPVVGTEPAAEAAAVDSTPTAEPDTEPEPAPVVEPQNTPTADAETTEAAVEQVPAPQATAAPTHHTDTREGDWDAATHTGRLPSPMSVATANKVYAWHDADRVEDGEIVKDACNLPHHEVGEDGTPGAAVLPGVRNALSRLPQSDIPEAEHEAIRAHLRAHLDDADQGEQDHNDTPATAETDTDVTDGWASVVAHLTTPADPWAELTAHLAGDNDQNDPLAHLRKASV